MPSLEFDRQTTISFPGESISPITQGIVDRSLSVREILCSNRLAFGDINSNQFQCQLYNCPDLTGKKIQVTQTDSDGSNPEVMFTGFVDSCKTDEISGFKTLLAYDVFYYARKKKVKGWWNQLWGTATQKTIGYMWRSLLSYYGISYTDTNLIVDNIPFKRNKQNKKIRTKSITSFLCQVCELSMAIPKVGRDGVVYFYKLYEITAQDVIDIRGYYVKSQSKIEDYKVTPYTKVELYDSNNKLKASAGSGSNLLSIKNNMLLYGQKQEYFTELANLMMDNMHTIEYYPANLTMKLSQLDVKLGDVVQTDKGYCLVSENNYTGSILVDQSIVSTDQDEYSSGGSGSEKETSLGDTLEREDYRLQYEIDNKNSNYVDDLELTDLDDLGIEGDFYTKTGTNVLELHGLDRNSLHWYSGVSVGWYGEREYDHSSDSKITNFQWTNKGYQLTVSGNLISDSLGNDTWGTPILKLTGIRSTGKHYFHCKIAFKMSANVVNPWNNTMGITFSGLDGYKIGGPNPSDNNTYDSFVRFGGGGDTGGSLNIGQTQEHYYEYTDWFNVNQADVNKGYIWVWFERLRARSYTQPSSSFTMNITEFYVYHENETYTKDDIDKLFINMEKKDANSLNVRGLRNATRSANDDEPEREWKELKFLSEANDDGFYVEGKKIFLDKDILRMWFHANPPQTKRDFNQLCARFTGKPASGVTIKKVEDGYTPTDWSYGSCKKDKEGVYTITNHGAYVSGSIQQVAYKIEGLTSGQTYYFNFRCGYTGAEFYNNSDKSLGLVFSTNSSVDTTAFSGDPHTFDEENLYASFYRLDEKRYYDFSFAATASTMYMIFVFGDIKAGADIHVTADSFIISLEQKKYARSLYMYDTENDVWVRYKPFGMSGDDDGESEISYLSELNDVTLDNPQTGQVLSYNATSGAWINANGYTLPVASAQTLGGIKVGTNLSIDANGVLSATGGGGTSDLDAISLTQEQYDALTPAEKADPDKLYFITDGEGGGGGGGGGGSSVIVNPLLTQGTPIAEITVDGITQTLYAPGGGGALTSTYTRIQQTEYSSADVDTSADSYTLISDPNT